MSLSSLPKARSLWRINCRGRSLDVEFQVVQLTKSVSGDYDGDQAWVCWDPDIVQPFRNADVPPFPELESYGIEKDKSTVADIKTHPNYTNIFLRHAFEFNLQPNMLGICTLYHESYCYHQKAINSPQALSIAILLGNLVDSAKGGFQFDEAKWAAYLKRNNLRRTLLTPAYKDRQKAKPTDHLIDHLVFVVAKRAREKALKEFDRHFTDVDSRDADLFRIRNEEVEEAKTNQALATVLRNLETDLRAILAFWRTNARPSDPDEDMNRPPRRPDLPPFGAVVERCRADFVNLKPTLNDLNEDGSPPNGTEPSSSDSRIRSWQCDHARGRASHWDLLKASVAFYLFHQRSFVWYVAGVELGAIKAAARGRGAYRCVVGEVFEALKVDRRVVERGLRRREEDGGGVGGEGGGEEGDEEEFGVLDWGVVLV